MNVDAILISEYATLTDNNQALTVIRTIHQMAATDFPVTVPLLAVSFVVHAHWDERGTTHRFHLKLLNERREEIGPGQRGSFTIPPGDATGPVGIPLRHSAVARYANVRLEEPGPYAFELYIDDTYHAGAAFRIIHRDG